jgi:hypothetical protein
MPTILYLVHGMGCGTADGSAVPAGQRWSDAAIDAVNWITDTYRLSRATVLDPVPDQPPAGSDKPDAVWIVPVSYHAAFDDFRRGATDRKARVQSLGIANLVDAYVTGLTQTDFAWVNCLDVLLWWADTAQARPMATATILATITRADDLAHQVPGATIRRILVSHSLGTAATTYALRHLGTKDVWAATGGFEFWATLANVAPFLMPTADVYAPPLLPGRSGTIVRRMCNVHHEADPIPWLMPWRPWRAENAGPDWRDAWKLQAVIGNLVSYQTLGVAAPPGRTPEIANVHGFANYLMSADVSQALAGALRGAAFDQQEMAALNPAAAWQQLPQLTCSKTQSALADLKAAKELYVKNAPVPPGDPVLATAGWLERLLRAAGLLLEAQGKCS